MKRLNTLIIDDLSSSTGLSVRWLDINHWIWILYSWWIGWNKIICDLLFEQLNFTFSVINFLFGGRLYLSGRLYLFHELFIQLNSFLGTVEDLQGQLLFLLSQFLVIFYNSNLFIMTFFQLLDLLIKLCLLFFKLCCNRLLHC